MGKKNSDMMVSVGSNGYGGWDGGLHSSYSIRLFRSDFLGSDCR